MIKPSNIAQPQAQEAAKGGDQLIESIFQLFADGVLYEGVSAKLHRNSIQLKVNNKNFQTEKDSPTKTYIIRFDFDLCFEMVRPSGGSNKKWNINECYAIKFDKQERYLELRYPTTEKHLTFWRNYLRVKLNQRGFHQQFTAIQKIGTGTFAQVFRIQSKEDKSKYATKAFSKQAAYKEDGGKECLINQIQMMREFNHQNLMKIYGVYQTPNSLYLVVELLAQQLFEKINQQHKFSYKETSNIMKSILNGLHALHSRGYMHRDIKPENILFKDSSKNAECVIADFGLVQKVSNSLMFLRCGTPGYVAPEIVNLKDKDKVYDCKCDIFSLGVIFHLLLLNKSPFSGTTYDDVMVQNKACKINFDAPMYKKLSAFELNLLTRMLEKDPNMRVSTQEALSHEYFQVEPEAQEETKPLPCIKEMKPKKKPKVVRAHQKVEEQTCVTPIMLTSNVERKKVAFQQSSNEINFRMGEHISTVLQKDQKNEGFNSPGAMNVNFSNFGQAESDWINS